MLTLTAEKRDILGKNLKKNRKADALPAVFYGRKEKSTPIFVPYQDFLKVWKQAGESSVIALNYPDKELNALISDVSYDPVRGEPIHVDFYVVEADRVVEVSVSLDFIGTAPAVKEFGGTLLKVLHEVPISGLPKDLPNEIAVDVASLMTLESRILVKDLPIPTGIKILLNPNEVVALVSVATPEEEVPEEPVFDAAAIEVEKKGKKEEEGIEGEEPAKKETAKKGPEKK